ncbi:MAG: ArsC family (seleno)protein [Phycisphaerae bacterium]
MPKQIDWHYQRKNCDACDAAAAELASLGVTPAVEIADARKLRFDAVGVARLARNAKRVISIRRRVASIEPITAKSPSDADLAKLMLGPTGNLRAPTIRVGDTLVVGFDAQVWREVLK